MTRISGWLTLLIACVMTASSYGATEKRVALVIGNSSYAHLQPLSNPATDATDMAAALEGLGYDVVLAENLGKDGFKQATQRFLSKINDADAALLFYAGHAVQVESVNYLLPIDATLKQPTDVLFDAIPLQDIMRLMERSARTSIVLVDACRDNPMGQVAVRNGTRGVEIEQGLAAENASAGSYVAFAAQPGKPSFDGTGRNSPFTTALLGKMSSPETDIRLVMADVREAVAEATNYQQIPWESSSLVGRFTLNPGQTSSPGLVILPAGQELPTADKPAEAAARAAPEGVQSQPPEQAKSEVAAVAPPSEQKAIRQVTTDRLPAPSESGAPAAPAPSPLPDQAAATDASPSPASEAASPSTPGQASAAIEAPPAVPVPESSADPLQDADGAENEEDASEMAALDPASFEEGASGDLVMLVQRHLIRVGCLTGSADGEWGPKSRAALADWTGRRQVSVDSQVPTHEALSILRGERGRICPAVSQAPRASRPETASRPTTPRKARTVERRPTTKRSGGRKKGYFGWQQGGNGVQFCTTCPDS